MDLSGRSAKAQFKIADREAAKFCVILGDDELARQEVKLKLLADGTETSIPRTELISRLK